MINVVAALICQDEKLLICKRPEGATLPLLWELPGGKVEQGETPFEAIIRECEEELDVTIAPVEIFDNAEANINGTIINFTFIKAKLVKGTPKNLEHEEIKWINISEIDDYEFCAADIEVLERLKNKYS